MSQIKPCPECGSKNQYAYKKEIEPTEGIGSTLLPRLNKNWLSPAKYLPVVCADCGNMRFFASQEARDKLKESKYWSKI